METTQNHTTEQVVVNMLRYNTGRHLLDSGGAYGRNWERNQDRDFAAEPAERVEFSTYQWGDKPMNWEVDYRLSLYHYLTNWLVYVPELDEQFHAFCDLPEHEDDSYLELMETFCESIGVNHETVNTYNGESNLDQVMQYVHYCDADDNLIVIVSVHGGCDVRGGYAKPHVFRVNNRWDPEYFHWNHAADIEFCAIVDGVPHYYDKGGEAMDGYDGNLADYSITDDPEMIGKGMLVVHDGNMYHPNGSQIEAFTHWQND